LQGDDWKSLYHLAHFDRGRAYDLYIQHYLATSGQIYWSDTHQLSHYADDYHCELDRSTNQRHVGSEMITEIYVPRDMLTDFMHEVRKEFRNGRSTVIYGTIRLIKKDTETYLAWAKEDYACIIFNLHVDHTPAGLERARCDFQCLIDLGLNCCGSYYLTYHRWARRNQVEAAYPNFNGFLKKKMKYDETERFQSQWYRHYKNMFVQMFS